MTELVSILGVHLFTISDYFYSIERRFERSQNFLQFKRFIKNRIVFILKIWLSLLKNNLLIEDFMYLLWHVIF